MNFARKAKRVARRQHRHGLITDTEYAKVKKAVRDPKIVKKWQEAVEEQMVPPWKVSAGFIDWGAVWDWLVKNWPKIQAILLKLLPLLILEPNPVAKPKPKPVARPKPERPLMPKLEPVAKDPEGEQNEIS